MIAAVKRAVQGAAVIVLAGCAGRSGAEARDEVDARAAEVELASSVAAGRQLFLGRAYCHVCHGREAAGTPLAPSLIDSVWINVQSPTLANVVSVIEQGVAAPVSHPAPMPPMGGAQLSEAEIRQLAVYVLSLTGTGD